MKTPAKILVSLVLMLVSSFALSGVVQAASPSLTDTDVIIEGVVYDEKHQPVAGAEVRVVFCNDVNTYIPSVVTDDHGHYIIKTDTDHCPLGNELTVAADLNHGGNWDGITYSQVHSHTTVDINFVPGWYMPEYSWLTSSAALITGVGAISLVRRRLQVHVRQPKA